MPGDLASRLLDASRLEGDFVLSSGRRSSFYFDKFRFLAHPALLQEVAEAVRGLLPAEATHLAAPEGGAALLLAAVGLRTGLPMALVRKERKPYGTRSRVEGYAPADAAVALLEDVSTTGHQALAATRALEEAGARVSGIVLVIDRGGGEHLREAGYRVAAVASTS